MNTKCENSSVECVKTVGYAIQIERAEIVKTLEGLPFHWDGDKQQLWIDKRELVELIKERASRSE